MAGCAGYCVPCEGAGCVALVCVGAAGWFVACAGHNARAGSGDLCCVMVLCSCAKCKLQCVQCVDFLGRDIA